MSSHARSEQNLNIRIWRADPTGSVFRAAAQTYPDRVVQIIAPATAGSSADILGRVLAPSASPDGYTLLHGATYSITVEPLTDKQAGCSVKSFTPICQTDVQERPDGRGAAKLAAEDGDLVDAAKRKPGAVTVGIPGIAISRLGLSEDNPLRLHSQLSTTCPLQFPQLSISSPVSFDRAPSISRVSSPAINSPATKMSGLTVET